jgi:uncharacterized protein YbbK (DUF523 family)
MKLVSACLAGFSCKWNGNSKPSREIIEMVMEGKAIPVCPEQLGGLPTPRDPAEQKGDRIFTKYGDDVTEQFTRGASEVLNIARIYGATEFIGNQNSPSCGCGFIYDGTFSGKLIKGNGVTTSLLHENGFQVRPHKE